jgi:alpha-galactosidase
LLGRDDQALLCFALRSTGDPVMVRAGMVEESAELLVSVEVALDSAGIEILLDATTSRFDDAVRRMGAAVGLHLPAVSNGNVHPVLCTWYSLHQNIDEASLSTEGRLAAGLGFRTIIVDDGWQTADAERGYGSCGDWMVAHSKIPDPAGLVSRLRSQGVDTMWWIGTPFLGERSASRTGKDLPTLFDVPHLAAAVLDPRSARVRKHLLERLTGLIASTGATGLKIDFLEYWARTPPGPLPDDAVSRSVPGAALSFLDDLRPALEELAPDLRLEFREPYVGPHAAGRATMLRVADCPMSPAANRKGIVDLRLTTAGVAIHADPVMWGSADAPERVAQHLHNTIFGVPQVSLRLQDMPTEHRDVLSHWLGLWNSHRDVLLTGTVSVTGVADGYRSVAASKGSTVVTAHYAPDVSAVPPQARRWLLVNAHDSQTVLIDAGDVTNAQIDIVDCRGRRISSSTRTLRGLTALPIPPGGTAALTTEHGNPLTGRPG